MTASEAHQSPDEAGPCLRVLLVDARPMFRDGVRAALEHTDKMRVVAAVGDARAALELLGLLPVDVVVMDLDLPDRSGVDAIRTLARRYPHIRALGMAERADDALMVDVLGTGGRGYVVKDAERTEIVEAVRTVGRGGLVVCPRMASRFAALLNGVAVAPDLLPFPALSVREREVLDLVAAGHDNRSIARKLVLSDKTVRNHVSAILSKMQVPNRAQAIVKARTAGLGRSCPVVLPHVVEVRLRDAT